MYISMYASLSNDRPEKILDLEKYNGRINIIQPPNMEIQFKMTEKIMVATGQDRRSS